MTDNAYESDELLQQYLLFHYGEGADQLPWSAGPRTALGFPQRCVAEGIVPSRLPSSARALDIGCAVGRAAFALAEIFEEVVGIDYSAAFIGAANELLEQGQIAGCVVEAGRITREVLFRRPSRPRGQLLFETGDAQALRPELGSFDAVLAANLLCRLAQPQRFLARLPFLVRPGGQLVITTPNTWLESFTAREFWLGATPETGEPLEALRARLEADFQLDAVWDMPFLIREHRRKYQCSVAQASRWIRRS